MEVYWIMFLYTVIVSYIIEYMNKQQGNVISYQSQNMSIRTVGLFGAVTSFALIILFSGVRGYVADTTAYIYAFQEETRTLADVPGFFADFANVKGPLWIALQIFVKNYIYDDVTVMLMIVAIFQGFAIAKTFSRYSDQFTFSTYLFVTGYTFYWMLNGTRQFMAVCILLLASKYLFNKEFGKYLLWTLVATCFHSTAIICIVVYFVAQGEPFNKRVLWTIALVLLCVLFLDSFTGILDSALSETQYGVNEQESGGESGMNPLTTLMTLVPIILIWWRKKVFFATDRPRYIDVMINVACVNVGICLLANFTSGITFGRLPVYFTIYNYILIPVVIERAFWGLDKLIIKYSCIFLYMVYFLYQSYVAGMGRYSTFYWKFFYECFSIKLF